MSQPDKLRLQVDLLYKAWLAHGYNDFRTQEQFNNLLQIRNEEQLDGPGERPFRDMGRDTPNPKL